MKLIPGYCDVFGKCRKNTLSHYLVISQQHIQFLHRKFLSPFEYSDPKQICLKNPGAQFSRVTKLLTNTLQKGKIFLKFCIVTFWRVFREDFREPIESDPGSRRWLIVRIVHHFRRHRPVGAPQGCLPAAAHAVPVQLGRRQVPPPLPVRRGALLHRPRPGHGGEWSIDPAKVTNLRSAGR